MFYLFAMVDNIFYIYIPKYMIIYLTKHTSNIMLIRLYLCQNNLHIHNSKYLWKCLFDGNRDYCHTQANINPVGQVR